MKRLKYVLVPTMIAVAGLLGTAAHAQSKDNTIIFLSGPTADPFFGAMKRGTDAAAKELGIHYQYTTPPDLNDIVAQYTRLGEAAVARKPQALVIGNFFPDSIEPLIKKAVAAGIPTVVFNTGRKTWKGLGAIGFVGEDPELMGRAGGQVAIKAGVKNGLCINHVTVNPAVELRCKGYIDTIVAAGGKAKMISIPYEDTTNDQKLRQAIGGALMADNTVNGIFTMGPSVGMNAVAAAKQLNRKIVIGSADVSTAALESVKSGDMTFLLDQQPFVQGYYGLLMASQYVKYKVVPATEVNTGPMVIDAKNVDAVLEVNKAYPGLRGAN